MEGIYTKRNLMIYIVHLLFLQCPEKTAEKVSTKYTAFLCGTTQKIVTSKTKEMRE